MAASNSDMFTEVGSPGSATSLASPGHTVAGTTITVGSTSNWPTTTGVIFAIDTVTLVNGVETRDTGSYTEWEGVVTSGTTVDNLVLRHGTDQNYPAGSTTRVYIPVSSSRENRLAQGALVSLNQDGTLKDGAVDSAAVLANDVVTTAKILDANVTASKLATNTICLGYVQVTSSQSGITGSPTQVTGLTLTVTIPAGGRRVKITAFARDLVPSTTSYVHWQIWDGTVGSGTLLSDSQPQGTGASVTTTANVMAVVTPSAGSKTYNVGAWTSAGTLGIEAASTYPAFLLVEAI